jgi:hypothetical protein
MKPFLTRTAIGLVTLLLVCGVFLWWFDNYIHRSVFWLAWPGLLLAQAGWAHGWVVAALLLVVLPVGSAAVLRRLPWWRSAMMTAILGGLYCCGAWWFSFKAAVPLPVSTLYDSTVEQRLEYLEAYEEGYRIGVAGHLSSHCFAPKVESDGHYAGQIDGEVIFRRMLGWPDRDPDAQSRHRELGEQIQTRHEVPPDAPVAVEVGRTGAKPRPD